MRGSVLPDQKMPKRFCYPCHGDIIWSGPQSPRRQHHIMRFRQRSHFRRDCIHLIPYTHDLFNAKIVAQ